MFKLEIIGFTNVILNYQNAHEIHTFVCFFKEGNSKVIRLKTKKIENYFQMWEYLRMNTF